jgi:NDP-sugar pyrophosphorylase family protein
VSQTTQVSSSQLQDVPCLLLVGGLGTRLRPVLNDLPKPMAPIVGRPFLEYLVRWLGRVGVVQVILCAGYRSEKIQEYFQNGDSFGVRITYSLEDELLGTWGAIRQAAENLRSPNFLVLNGDSWLQVDLEKLVKFHVRTGGIATIAAADVRNATRFGSIQTDACGRIMQFAEKQTRGSGFVNGGIYVFSRAALACTPAKEGSLEREIFPLLVSRGLYAMSVSGYFIDIGVPEEYKRLQNDAKSWIQKLGFGMRGGVTC